MVPTNFKHFFVPFTTSFISKSLLQVTLIFQKYKLIRLYEYMYIIRIWGAESILVTVRDDATLCEWLSDVWELRGG